MPHPAIANLSDPIIKVVSTCSSRPAVDESLDCAPPPMPDVSKRLYLAKGELQQTRPPHMDGLEVAKTQETDIIAGLPPGEPHHDRDMVATFGIQDCDSSTVTHVSAASEAVGQVIEQEMPAYMWGVPCAGESARIFVHEYSRRCAQTPQTTFRVLLVATVTISFAGSVVLLSSLEYLLYYVSADPSFLSTIEAALRVPQALIKGFLFPLLGRAVDGLARKKMLTIAMWAGAVQAVLIAFIPSVTTVMIAEALSVIRDAASSFVVPALTRDLFPRELWEVSAGGYTNIMAQVLLWNTSASVMGVFFAGGVFTFSMLVFGHVSEYSMRKDECSETHCVPEGQYSWSSSWGIDGSLRVLMIFGAILLSGVAALLSYALPETLPEEQRKKGFSELRRRWPQIMQPWSNLRCFATLRLRLLLLAQQLQLMQRIGMVAVVFALQRRFAFNSLELAGMAALSILGALPPLLLAQRIVEKIGDLRGIWIPAFLFIIGACVTLPLIPLEGKPLVYVVTALMVAPGSMLATMLDALLAKLFPSNLQATWRTGKGFLYQVLNASLVFPFNFVLNASEDWPFPFDLCILWVNGFVVSLALLVALYVAAVSDPHEDIKAGHALDDFLNSSFGMGYSTTGMSVTSSTNSSMPSAKGTLSHSTASSLESLESAVAGPPEQGARQFGGAQGPLGAEVVGHAAS